MTVTGFYIYFGFYFPIRKNGTFNTKKYSVKYEPTCDSELILKNDEKITLGDYSLFINPIPHDIKTSETMHFIGFELAYLNGESLQNNILRLSEHSKYVEEMTSVLCEVAKNLDVFEYDIKLTSIPNDCNCCS